MTRTPKDTDPALERLLESGANGTSSRRSPLYLWFRQHHRKLAAQAATLGGAPWADWISEIQADPRLLDRNGQTPKLRTAQATWYKVCDAMQQERSRRPAPRPKATQPALPPGQVAVGVYPIDDTPEAYTPPPPPPAPAPALPRKLRVATSLPGMPNPDQPLEIEKPAPPVSTVGKWPKPII